MLRDTALDCRTLSPVPSDSAHYHATGGGVHIPEACGVLAPLPSLQRAAFSFADPRTPYDFQAVLQIIGGKDSWEHHAQSNRHSKGRVEARWDAQLGAACAGAGFSAAEGAPAQRLRAVRFLISRTAPLPLR